MLERLIDWSLEHRAYVLVGALVVLGLGTCALRSLNVDAFADTTPVQVQINTQTPALVPEEVERQITLPVELALGGMPGLEEVRSISMYGLSQVVATFAEGTDVYFARQQVYQRLSAVPLPPKIGPPELGPPSTGLGEVFHYLLVPRSVATVRLEGAVGSPSTPEQQPIERDLAMLRTLQDRKIKPALRQVPGTAEANSWGGFEKQYQVRLDPAKLQKYDLSFDQVVSALRENNLNAGGGNVNFSGDMLLVHGRGRTVNLEQIENIVIVADAGVAVCVKDVARVCIGHAVRRGGVTATVRDQRSP
ncbi:MAG TPA: efflux RND transporter permease subunit, partial [Pirellulales bacterium]|nr:efflux RND transporter permease subunit [Pirellulales bacterium]